MTDASPSQNSRPAGSAGRKPPIAMPLFAALMLIATAVAYLPSLTGTPIWDDVDYILPPAKRTFGHLYRIWFDLQDRPSYYPLSFTAFWIEGHLWGDSFLMYHVTNLALHLTCAWLLAAILKQLEIPGGWLAAALFAIHPVFVESVAWLCEIKNTLSGVLGLAAVLYYLKFDNRRLKGLYVTAFVLFVLSLTAKSTTTVIPAVLALLCWYRRGMTTTKSDVRRLIPFFVASIATGVFTIWYEQKVGAKGESFALSPFERLMLAGRVPWFYLKSLVWPTNLVFSYPKWELGVTDFPYALATSSALLSAWLLREYRGFVAGILIYLVCLFPVMGFFNIYYFRYSFVADHFQYLPSIPVIVAFAWLMTRTAWTIAVAALLLIPLASLTWTYSKNYVDEPTLYASILRVNDQSWLAHNNLGVIKRQNGLLADAQKHFERAIQLSPQFPETHNNLGTILAAQGDLQGAEREFLETIRLKPNDDEAHANLGRVYALKGYSTLAIEELNAALNINPRNQRAHWTLSQMLADSDPIAAEGHRRKSGR